MSLPPILRAAAGDTAGAAYPPRPAVSATAAVASGADAAPSPSPARSFKLQMQHTVWRNVGEATGDEASWEFEPRECRIACPCTLPEFYAIIERRLGLRVGSVKCTLVDNPDEELQDFNYSQQLTGTAVKVELKQPDGFIGDVSTPTGLRDLTNQLSSGAEWMKLATREAEMPPFSFRIRGCTQLSLDDSSFVIPGTLTQVFDPVKDPKPRFHATLDPMHPDCYTSDLPYTRSSPFDGVRLTGNIDIDVGNADNRFDRPFWHMLDRLKMKPVMSWTAPCLDQPAARGHDIEKDRWAAKVAPNSGLSKAACEFLEKAYAGELVFYCDAAFSKPETRAFRLAIRVLAIHGPESPSRFRIEGFMLPINFFFQNAKRHHNDMLYKQEKLGLVWDLDHTLIHANPSKELLAQVRHDPARRKSITGYDNPVVLRKDVRKTLERLSSRFEMHLFCNGSMSHATCVLDAFNLNQFFVTVTSGYWTTRNRLAFGVSGCKDFRSIFDFHRFPQFQETVLAVDDLVQTWNNAPKLWKRAAEKPCVLQITGFGTGPTHTSVTNTTMARFETLLRTIHGEFRKNEDLRREPSGITENARLHVPRKPGFMNRHRDDVERKLFTSMERIPPSPSRRLYPYEQLARDLLDNCSADEVRTVLADVHRYDNDSLRGMIRHLGLDEKVYSEAPGDIRATYVDRLVFYCQDPREGCIRITFEDSSADINVYEGMPMHDFIHSVLDALRKNIRAKLEPLVKGANGNSQRNFDVLAGDPHMFELRDKPNSPITTEAWFSVFSAEASTAKLSLQLDLTKQARIKYRISHRSRATHVSTADALPHPSAFVKQRHKFEGKVFYALLELIANSLDATRHNQGVRQITVELHEEGNPGRGPSSYCVSITDNGRGMDESGLTAAVTYGLARDIRGMDMNRLDGDIKFLDSVFNRFGVGMLDASFSMGDNVYVMTKQAQDHEVRQVSLEYDAMCRRYNEGGTSAYEFPVVSRDVAQAIYEDEVQIPKALAKYESIKDMVAREPTDGSFTTVIVRGVKPELVQQFYEHDPSREDVWKLADDLGHTYHYFMTADQPDATVGPARCLTIHPEQPLRLHMRLPGKGEHIDTETIDTKDITSLHGPDGNLEHRFQQAGKNERWFFVRYYKGLAEAKEALRTVAGSDRTQEIKAQIDQILSGEPYIALGILRYFPSCTFVETHPLAIAPYNAEGQRQVQILPDIQVECRWQGQTLVKQTEKMGSLPFAERRAKKAEIADIPETCFKRWRCTLFCSGHWDVGSNKMELALPEFSKELKHAEFSRFMTTTELAAFGTYEVWNAGASSGWQNLWKCAGHDTQPRQDFRKWLQECHQNYDEDLAYESSFAPDPTLRAQLAAEDRVEGGCWRKVVVSAGMELCSGDLFSFKQPNKKIVYAKAVLFCRDPAAEESAGSVYYQQLPDAFYPQLVSRPLDTLIVERKMEFTVLRYDEKKLKRCNEAVAKELELKLPKRFVVETWRSSQRDSREKVAEGAGVITEANVRQFFCVDIVNQKGKSIAGQKVGDIKLQVRLVAHGPFETEEEAQNADPTANLAPGGNDPPTKPIAVNDQNGSYKQYQKAGFYAIDFQCVLDTQEFQAKVAAGERLPDMPFPFDNHRREILEVKGSKVNQLWFAPEFRFKSGGMFDGGIRIGSTAEEPIELVLTDKHNNEITATQAHLRGLTIVATAKKDNLVLEQRLDKSSGLKLTATETLLLKLSWSWPTDEAWSQPLSPAGRPAKFKVTLTSEMKSSTGEVERLKKLDFSRGEYLELWPRAPTGMLVDMPDVTIGDDDPPIKVTFTDQNGNESLPMRDESRTVEVSMKLGGKTFNMCKPKAPENVQESVASSFDRAYRNRGFLAVFKGHASREALIIVNSASHNLRAEKSVTILQPSTPVAATVYCGADKGKKIVRADCLALEYLHIKLQNSLGNDVEWADQTPTRLTWNGEVIPGLGTDYAGALPDLDLSNVRSVSRSPYIFDGLATFTDPEGSETSISLRFEVELVAGTAVRWMIEEHSSSIQINKPGELESAFSVLPIDANGNRGADPDSTVPIIELRDAPGSESLELRHGGFKEESRAAGVKAFQPKRNATLSGIIPTRDPYVYLQVSDANGSLEPVNFSLNLQPGDPTKLRLVHSILTEHDDQYNASVPAVWQLQGLEAHLVDVCGNRVAKSDVNLSLTGKNVACSKIKKRTDAMGTAKFTARSDLQPLRTLGNGAGSYTLEVSAGSAQISPAKINCVVELTNAVTDLVATVNTDATATAGELLPPGLLTVTLDTQDGEAFLPDASMFEVILQQNVRHRWKTVASAAMATDDDGISETTTWQNEPAHKYIPTHAGEYRIKCKYTDNRSGLNSVHEDTATLKVAGGAAHHLEAVSGLDCPESITNGSDRIRRIVISKLLLQVKDQHGNDTTLSAAASTSRTATVPSDGTKPQEPEPQQDETQSAVVATLHNEDGTEITGALEGAQAAAVGAGDMGRYVLEEVSLRESAGGERQTSLFIRLSVIGVASRIESIDSQSFEYMPAGLLSEQAQQKGKRIAKLKKQLHDINEQEKGMDQALTERQQELVETTGSIEAKQVALESVLNGIPGLKYQPADLADQKKVESITQHCNRVQDNIRERKPKRRRALSKPMPADGTHHGDAVVEIGHVADEREAKVLSWAAGARIKAIFARDSSAQDKLDQHGRASFAEDQLIPFQVRDSGRPRTRNISEKEACALPLRLPLEDGKTVVIKPGERVCIGKDIPPPQFAVNMFDLTADKEHYRDTLLWSMYRNMLVMNTVDDARRYRQACAKERRPCPSIYTLDGRCIKSDGFNDPNARMPESQDWCFGSLSHTRYPEFELAEKAKALLVELDDLLSIRTGLQNTVDAMQDDDYTPAALCDADTPFSRKDLRRRKTQLEAEIASHKRKADGEGALPAAHSDAKKRRR